MDNHKRYESMQVAINKRFSHDLSHQHLTTMDFFRLQPLSCIECVAGDAMKVNVQSLIESAPLATKVYGSYHLDLHAFFVPFRLLWDNWVNYQYSNQAGTEFGLPCFDMSLKQNVEIFSPSADTAISKARRAIFGSLGYPVNQLSKEYPTLPNLNAKRLVSLMPARAFQQIWWDWFRDSVSIHENNKPSYLRVDGGEETNVSVLTSLFEPRYRTFRKDYITTILSGASAVIPGTDAEVDNSIDILSGVESASGKKSLFYADGNTYANTYVQPSNSTTNVEHLFQSIKMPVLRGALALQRWLERLGVSGSRPLERIVSNFGVRPEPVRLQMAEFIGTKRINIGIDGLINTGSSALLSNPGSYNPTNPFGSDYESFFGTFTGKSSAGGRTEDWSYNATEHGYLMVIGSIMPNYINDGYLDPMFFRGLSAKSEGSKDFFVPEMDGSGYTPVLLGHIANPLRNAGSNAWKSADIDQVVGYQPRYEDYRYIMDKISGDFNEPDTRNYLRNMAFIRNLTETLEPSAVVAGLNLTTPDEDDRALFDNHFQVTDGGLDHFIVNNYIVVDAVRPISASVLPTELSNLANKDLTEVSRGGIRL